MISRNEAGKTEFVLQKLVTAEEITSDEFQRMLRGRNANRFDIYLSANPLREDAHGRTKQDIAEIRHIYLDVDGGGLPAVRAIQNHAGMPHPHSIIETSPGKHQLVWQVYGFDEERAESLMKAMAQAHGTDPAATDTARCLRVPGFRNWKYDEPKHYVKWSGEDALRRNLPRGHIENTATRMPYAAEDFPRYPGLEVERVVIVEAKATHAHRQIHSIEGGQTQSHRDWRYAMTQLEAGRDPAVIASEIADYRRQRGDKDNPDAYARTTMKNAVDEMGKRLAAERAALIEPPKPDNAERSR